MSSPRPKVAAVLATCNRLEMLAERSLPSIAGQTRPPDLLVVVDDSDPRGRPSNAALVAAQLIPDCRVVYLENQRTKGASGTWNTALAYLAAKTLDPSQLFVAVLDDDDSWSATYLEQCLATARNMELDMVAADLCRFESLDEPPLVNQGPAQLRADDFLTGNPGIQGSNLFVRLSVLLAAGGFDEALQSTTDRDLCIRIADLGSVRYGRLAQGLVNHFADPARSRLSTRGSRAKVEGLAAFWRKYVGRMSTLQRRAFTTRSQRLFDWRPPDEPGRAQPVADTPHRALVLGLLTGDAPPGSLLRAARELAQWRDDTLVGLDLVLLERAREGEAEELDEAAALLRDCGAGCFRVSPEQGRNIPALDEPAASRPHQLLAIYCAQVAATRLGTQVWLCAGPQPEDECPHGNQTEELLRWLNATRAESEASILEARGQMHTCLDQWIQEERVATAKHRLERRFSLEQLRLLGCGSEAVVLTDGRRVYKCIDYWKTRMPRSQLDFLRSQIGRWTQTPGLYALLEVIEDGPWAVLIYDYEASSPYEGGHEAGLIRLLEGCRAAGIVCNNVHPKNLVVTTSEVKLIDYGSDIRPWTPLGFEHMARRAFLTCTQATHPELRSLMRRALSDTDIAEMAGYSSFAAQLSQSSLAQVQPSRLYVGVISSDPKMLEALLHDLAALQRPGRLELSALVLDNHSPADLLRAVVDGARRAGLALAIVDEARQRQATHAGAFGSRVEHRPPEQVGIAQARTMLQRYLGALQSRGPGSFAWVLDDDMRVDARAHAYLSWLPAFRKRGVDVLIGSYEGSSPNPPLNGLRVQLVDLLHNLHWLRSLPPGAPLPDRSAENAALRARYPDYYYDLSRKHTAHLEMPHWLEPAHPGETVHQAYARLQSCALALLSGAPITRALVATPPTDPLASAKDSVNRGGCTFILNPHALTQTPNTITSFHGHEARRSDMIWSIVNRHYRRMCIQAVAFPVHHIGRINASPRLDIQKVQAEIVGSTLYAGLTDFLGQRPEHELDFSPHELREVSQLADHHLDRRWRALSLSFHRIAGLRESIRALVGRGELQALLHHLDEWFTPRALERIRSGLTRHDEGELARFLASLRSAADDYAAASVDIEFIRAQLGASK